MTKICDQQDCDGVLEDTYRGLGSILDQKVQNEALLTAMSTDLLILVGVDASKKPVSIIPSMAKMNKAKIVIIREQPEGDDKFAHMAVYGPIEQVMTTLCEKLSV